MNRQKELENQMKSMGRSLDKARLSMQGGIAKIQSIQKEAEKEIDYENTSEEALEKLARAKKIENLARSNPEEASKQAEQLLSILGFNKL